MQILQGRLECFSRALKVLWIALKAFSMYLGGKRRWVGRFLFISGIVNEFSSSEGEVVFLIPYS